MAEKIFTRYCTTPDPVETLFAWHEYPGALERLTPPWMRLKNIRKTGGIETGAAIRMQMGPATSPIPLFMKMAAEHIDYEKNRFFKDRLTQGPFSKWEHTHTFSTCADGASQLDDYVQYQLPLHIPRTWNTMVEDELNRLFAYRHRVMLADLERHREMRLSSSLFSKALSSPPPTNTETTNRAAALSSPSNAAPCGHSPLTIVVSGASGPVGQALIPFLTTGGHRVITLVRRKPKNKDEIEWDPYADQLDLTHEDKIDVVINLNGYHIGSGRWTDQTKELIVESRNLSTSLLSDRITALPPEKRPDLFISASATGFYGECGDDCVDENSCCGSLFISEVCEDWEACAKGVEDVGIRTVFARMGVVLTPAGGALERLLPGFLVGLGTKIGSGKQYMSWISMDDLVYALYHIMGHKEISGPVNLVSPNPITNEGFTHMLASVVSRPAPFTVPSSLIRLVWGKMGEEVLLASTRVLPDQLTASGFRFSYPTLEKTLCHVLGK